MLKVAITGNIAAGKSTVESLLTEKGFKVLDADEVAHKLLRNDVVKKDILEAFAVYDIVENGELSRPKLGKIIFTSEEDRKKLESLLHPLIKEEIRQFFKAMEQREEIVFVSVPLLFEAKFEDLFDKIVLIYAEDEIRIKRLVDRNDLTDEMALNRLGLQMNQDKKKPLSGHIIFNNKTMDDLVIQVDNLIANFV